MTSSSSSSVIKILSAMGAVLTEPFESTRLVNHGKPFKFGLFFFWTFLFFTRRQSIPNLFEADREPRDFIAFNFILRNWRQFLNDIRLDVG